ncbi:hypothetical protein ACFT1B_35630 [Streptomyces griseoincarnatus]
MLAEDVTAVADGGGTPGVARLPVRGAEKVARYLTVVTSRYVEGLTVSVCEVNGTVAAAGWFASRLLGVVVPDVANGRITNIHILANPGKLRFVGTQLARLSHSEAPFGS